MKYHNEMVNERKIVIIHFEKLYKNISKVGKWERINFTQQLIQKLSSTEETTATTAIFKNIQYTRNLFNFTRFEQFNIYEFYEVIFFLSFYLF